MYSIVDISQKVWEIAYFLPCGHLHGGWGILGVEIHRLLRLDNPDLNDVHLLNFYPEIKIHYTRVFQLWQL